MPVYTYITDKTGQWASIRKIASRIGLVVNTRDDDLWTHTPLFFMNDEHGINMNQDAAFGGTPDPIHDGEDRSLWAGSNISGGSVDFSHSNRSVQAAITIEDYFLIDNGDSVNINGTVFAEADVPSGNEWLAETDNATTAANLATAINAVFGFSASSVGAVVSVTETTGIGLTVFSTNAGASEMTVSANESAHVNRMNNGNVCQFAKSSAVTMANFVAFTAWINVNNNWAPGDSYAVYAYDTSLGAMVGNSVFLEDYFDFANFDVWHPIVIPLSDMGLASETTVDAFRIEKIAQQGGQAPQWFIDDINLQAIGTPIVFKIVKDDIRDYWVHSLRFAFRDDITVLEANQFMGLPALTNGITYQRYDNGVVQFVVNIKTLQDLMTIGGVRSNEMTGNSETFVTFDVPFPKPIILSGPAYLNCITLTVSDELAELLSLNALVIGAYREN